MNLLGIILAITTFIAIGMFHPIVIKAEYYFGVRCWWAFALAGTVLLVLSLFISNIVLSSILGVLGCAFLWSIFELFEQRKRVKKGWFPKNPKREDKS